MKENKEKLTNSKESKKEIKLNVHEDVSRSTIDVKTRLYKNFTRNALTECTWCLSKL